MIENLLISSVNTEISVLFTSLLKEAQQQHGLRHQDYQRYRQYLSRRLERLRKSLNLLQGDKRRVTPRKLTASQVREPRHLQLILFQADRCWAYAMQLKAEANTEPRKRFHMQSRLRKAVSYADELATLSGTVGDACTKLEARAYASWMRGTLNFELERWVDAKENLDAAFKVYQSLAEVEVLEEGQRELYILRAEELQPQLRYCAYNIGDESAVEELRALRRDAYDDSAVAQLDALLSQTRNSSAAGVREVQWLGQILNVRHEKARRFLDELEELEQQLSEYKDKEKCEDARLSVYESLLKAVADAVVAVREDCRQVVTDNKLTSIQSYLQFIKLLKTIERNQLLLDVQLHKSAASVTKSSGSRAPEAAARLHDAILQSIQEIAQLTGVSNYAPLMEVVQLAVLFHKAQRARQLAKAYAANGKHAECLTLLARCRRHAQNAHEQLLVLSSCDHKDDISGLRVSREELEHVLHQAEAEELSCRAAALLGDYQEEERMKRDPRPLLERLSLYQEDHEALVGSKQPRCLVSIPPQFEPIEAKPLFFDLALNHVQFPSLEAEVAQTSSSRTGAGSGGISGFVKGWLWGSSGNSASNKK